MQPGLAVLQILQVTVIVDGEVPRFFSRRRGVQQAVHSVNLPIRRVIHRDRMLNARAREGRALIQMLQVIGHVLVVAAVEWHGLVNAWVLK